MPRSSRIVSTSSILRECPGDFSRVPLTRTWPASTNAAAWVRALTTRACHNHLSRRWRSKTPKVTTKPGHTKIGDPTRGIHRIVRAAGSVLAAGKLLFERGQFRKRRIRIYRTLTLARRRAAGVGAVRRSGIRTSLAAALAGALKPTLVLIPVSALVLEALARRTSFALAQFTAGVRSLAADAPSAGAPAEGCGPPFDARAVHAHAARASAPPRPSSSSAAAGCAPSCRGCCRR